MIKYKPIYKEDRGAPCQEYRAHGRPAENPVGGSGPRGEGTGAEADRLWQGRPLAVGRISLRLSQQCGALSTSRNTRPAGELLPPGKRCRRTDGTASRSSFHK